MHAKAATARPVLVLDADQGSALAIVRSLGRRGIAAACAAAQTEPIAAYSRYASESLRYPDPLTEEAAFIEWLAQRQRRHPDELVFPVTERTVVPLMRHRDKLDERRLALAPSLALEQVLDKSRTVALAEQLGVAVPRSMTLRSTDMQDTVHGLEAPWGYPVVVKPARSVGQSQQHGVHLTVSYATDARSLRNQVQHLLRYGDVILQEFFAGDGVGVELIADHGQIRHAFQHRRLHEVPLTGGGSSLRCSEPVAAPLLEASRKLVAALGWHGVAMVEFKFRPQTGDYRLMEINGRFWGSLPLAVAAGADFPVMLHELMTTGAVADRPPARSGVLCRQLARDVDWLEHVVRKAAPAGLAVLPSWGQVLRDSALVFSPRHHFDIQSLGDWRPGWVDLQRLVRKQVGRMRDLRAARRRLQAEVDAAQRAQSQLAPKAAQVLFLCYGNINRSALAHAHAQQCLSDSGRHFSSAGFHAADGRPADPLMVDTAARHGIRLEDWRSRRLTSAQVAASDLILAMETTHLDRLLLEHPSARGKAFLLGALRSASSAEIADPYGAEPDTYLRVCQQVRSAVDSWFGPKPTTP